ncbi:type IV pilus biogenesis/stability protein PilW [Ramlibacter algicola]|uniref:Type IV pilus biogenesis/stability protein PilW n=1 Tax=Ramlibacter algicola TaxID=2795217 RepID=A0A934PZ49_9BURK|nr:type IV pilus biogenesis/stability protein PilW [Ramlibacter algicola]MBK0393230.1 type IV pilus biogenesis/stability protein PilW [Ramlibacter algicola]
MDVRNGARTGALVALLPWAALLSSVVAISGCAGGPSPQAADTPAPFTESDEPEGRKRARIRTELATGYFEQGQTSVALDELKQAIAADPTYPDAYNLRGLIYLRMADNRQAEDSFRRAVALNPRDANTLHNLGWLQCQEKRWDESQRSFEQALASPIYRDRAKTLMTLGICQARAGRNAEGERNLARAWELEEGNPIVGYNLASMLFARGDAATAQNYIRRLNNSELANAETLWLGVKIENKLGDRVAARQLGEQLRKRFPQSREAGAYDRGAFNE